jgi:CRISPR type III-A-associated protein Csm2
VDNKNYNNYRNQGSYSPRQNNPYGGGYNQDAERKQVVEKLVECVKDLNENNVETFISGAHKFAKLLANVSASKFRNFYDEIISIVNTNKEDWNRLYVQLYLIKPKIAYAIGREDRYSNTRKSLESFEYLYDELMKNLNKDNLENFVKLMEAIVAYHKEVSSEGKKSNEEGGQR